MISIKNYKKELEQALYNKGIVESAFNSEIKHLEEQLLTIDFRTETYKKLYKAEKQLLEKKKTEKEAQEIKERIEMLERILTKEGLLKEITNTIEGAKETKEYTLNILNNEIYKEYINYIVTGKEISDKTLIEIDHSFLSMYSYIIQRVQATAVNLNNEIKSERIKNTFIVLINSGALPYVLNQESTIKQLKKQFKEEKEPFNLEEIETFIRYYIAVNNRATELYTRLFLDVKNESTIKKRGYHEYDNTSSFSLTELSKAMHNKQSTTYDIIERNINDVKIELSPTEESKETLTGLTPLEKRVIDVIISFYRNNIKQFTDVQIGHYIYGKDKKLTEDKLKSINNAIEKARTTFLEVKGNTKSKDKFFNSRNPFINLTHIGVKDENSKTQYYIIEGIPFYYTYTVRTGGQFISYDVESLTKQIEGIKSTEHTQSLRIYLQEKISNIQIGEEEPFIYFNDVYNLDFGNGKADTYKKRSNLTYQIEKMLEALQKEYNFTFKELKKRGKTRVGYSIIFNKIGNRGN